MLISKYLRLLNVEGKSFSLCAIAPKSEYPLKSYGNEFNNFAMQVLSENDRYVSIYENDRPEILQDVAFKLFTIPLFGDTYNIRDQKTTKEKRATIEQMEAFIVAKEFYATVPSGETTEKEAIESGIVKSRSFIERYPLSKYDIVIKNVSRHEDGVQFLYELEFDRDNKDYLFDYCYCN